MRRRLYHAAAILIASTLPAVLSVADAQTDIIGEALTNRDSNDHELEDGPADPIRILFNRARVSAATKATKLKICSFAAGTPDNVKTWLLTNKDRLADDITRSPHVWIRAEMPTCAMTRLEPVADIRFSQPTCTANVANEAAASKILVHESAHHFNLGEEAFADAISAAVMGAGDIDQCPGEQVMLTAAAEHACFLYRGNVSCWGFDDEGQVRVPRLRNPTAIKGGGWHSCAIDDEGLACWGNNEFNQTLVPTINDLRDFAVGSYHTCAIDGTRVKCWGGNWAQQLDPPTMSSPIALALGAEHSCAIDGRTVKCWGRNAQATPPALTNATAIAAGENHTCAIDSGRVVCWGDNRQGQTTVPALTEPKQIGVGLYHTCALDRSGVKCWGNNDDGQTAVPALTSPRQIAVGNNFACALDSVGVKCWGLNERGQTDVPTPLRTLQ